MLPGAIAIGTVIFDLYGHNDAFSTQQINIPHSQFYTFPINTIVHDYHDFHKDDMSTDIIIITIKGKLTPGLIPLISQM